MTANGHDEFYAVVRDEGERIRAFVTMLSSFAVAQHDEWDPIMIMLAEIDARLERLVSRACDEGHSPKQVETEAA